MKQMKTLRCGLATTLALTLSLVLVGHIFAQGNGLRLSLGKISGIGLGGQIQGLFGLSVSGPADMTSVTYLLDDRELGTVTQAPFGFQFSTDAYAPGQHRFTATARTASGQTLTSNSIDAEIVSFATGWQSMVRLLWPILLIVLLALVLAFAVPLLSVRRSPHYEPGAPRNYGLGGGTICKRCGRPFAVSLFGPNLLVGKLTRCPYCGKWSVAQRASPEALRTAEQAEVQNRPLVHEPTPEELLRRQIEDSRLSR